MMWIATAGMIRALRAEVEKLREMVAAKRLDVTVLKRLCVKDGDVVLLETPVVLSDAAIERVRRGVADIIKEQCGANVKVVVCEDGMKLRTILSGHRKDDDCPGVSPLPDMPGWCDG